MTTPKLGILTAIFIFFMVMLLATPPTWAVVGTVTVKVTDPMGKPVPDAKIILTPADPALPTKEAETDKDGSVIIPLVEQGSYTLRVAADDRVAVRDVTVRGGEITSVDVSVLPTAPAPPLVGKIFPPVERPPDKRFRVKIEGLIVSQERELQGSVVMGEVLERALLSTGELSTRRERLKITDLQERGRMEMGFFKLLYRLTDRIEIHGRLGAGQLATRLQDRTGQVLVEEFIDSNPLFSATHPFRNSTTHRGTGDAGIAVGAGFNIEAYRLSRVDLSFIVGSQWIYLESNNVLRLSENLVIDESRTHMVDIGVKGRLRQGRWTLFAGVKALWMLTEYEGHYKKSVLDRGSGEFLLSSQKKRFDFDTAPKAFPILGQGGVEYAITDSFGVQLDGAAGGSHTYSVGGGVFYQF